MTRGSFMFPLEIYPVISCVGYLVPALDNFMYSIILKINSYTFTIQF